MQTHPLVSHTSPRQVIAWRDGSPVTVRAFLAEVAQVAAALPPGTHVLNVCRDRYRFAVSLCAALVSGRISLLPSTLTPEMVRQIASFAPDAFCLYDAPHCSIDLPQVRYPAAPQAADSADYADPTHAPFDVPQIDAERVMAYVFTSGSTGTPVPHRKTWGFLVGAMKASAARLGLAAPGLADHTGATPTIIGTVPAQHMYGFETTVLLPLIAGLAFSNRQPFYPEDIRSELAAIPQPRVLVTSPIHLRALLASDAAVPDAALVLSATAPLAAKLASDAEARLHAPLVEIYGSTETGQIATRRTAQGATWTLYDAIRLEARDDASAAQDDGPSVWASGGHIETPVPMGDALELLDTHRFLLHGRKADLINIAGKRTSLAYLNHQLNAIDGVTDGVFFMPDEGARATPAAEPVTRLVALVVAPALDAARLQRALRERIDAAFMPRPLIFVDALPRNETGKLPHDVLAALVARHTRGGAQNGTQRDAQIDAEAAVKPALNFTIAADHPALPGHFPGHPIVPGVVLLDHAIDAIGAALDRPFNTWRLSAAKFLSPAAPGDALEVEFDTQASGAIRFTVRAGARDVASGTLSAATSAMQNVKTSATTTQEGPQP